MAPCQSPSKRSLGELEPLEPLSSDIDMRRSCLAGKIARPVGVLEAGRKNTVQHQNRVQKLEHAPCTSEVGSCWRSLGCIDTR